jgi:hypothetical protein
MYLVWEMLAVLVAAYGLCGALVLFAERAIQPRASERSDLAVPPPEREPQRVPPREQLPQSTSSG